MTGAQSSSSATEIALRLLQASSCFRPGAACGSLPCACAQSLVDALSQIAGVRDGWKLVPERPTHRQMDAGLYQSSADSTYGDVWSIYADMIDTAPSLDNHSDQTTQVNKDATTRAISPQAQAGETEQEFEDRLMKQDAADNLRLLDYIADKIGLHHDQELSRESFVAWFNVRSSHSAQASIDRSELLRGLAEFFSESVHHVWSNSEIALYLADMAAEASASPPAALPAGTWQPIETAPKDHHPILVYGPYGQFVAFKDAAWAWWPVPATDALDCAPTHWKPLGPIPSVPSTEGK